ncbi:hypothetical protein, partial [Photobacterium phosphoreum]|uniref:hypothetical protein n=1 Tax=Photobacterium phosphoreum TaxID=659 RepID=UPI001E55A12F
MLFINANKGKAQQCNARWASIYITGKDPLKRYIVVHVGQINTWRCLWRGRTRLGRALLTRSRWRLIVFTTPITAFAAAQHLHLVGDNISAVEIGARILVLPFTWFKA